MPLDVGRTTHLTDQMHRSEDDAGDPIDEGLLLGADGARGHTWYDPATLIGATTLAGLTDVDLTTPAENDTLRFIGGFWVNDNRVRADVTNGFDTFVWEGDDLVWEWST